MAIINVETCLAASYEGSGGIRGATAAILRPDRTNKLEIVQNNPRLLIRPFSFGSQQKRDQELQQ